MSTSAVPQPDVSNLPAISQPVAQAPASQPVAQAPASQPVAPAPAVPAVGPRLASTLSAIVSASTPSPTPVAPVNNTPARPAWQTNLGKVAGVVSTALAGVPAGGRPSFAGGLGQGARAENAAQQQAAAFKFASFNDANRAADLHAQDLQKQAADDAQQKAQQAAEDFQREAYEGNDGTYNTHPNNGTAVSQTLAAQTASNGGATITPGTHISADGKNILVPGNDPKSLAAQVQNYRALEGVLPGLSYLPDFDPSSVKSMADVVKARNALGTQLHTMSNLLQGYDISGRSLTHQELSNLIPAYQSQIEALSKSNNGATDYQLGTLKNTLAILQANEGHHSDAEQTASDRATANAVAKAKQIGDVQTANKEAVQDNAAGNRPTKVTNADWVPGVSSKEKNNAELGENIAFNANSVAATLMKRPDLLGAIAGRYTNAQQMIGNNDPDISAIGTHIHNLAMANSGIHGFRNQQGVTDYEKQLLNNFKNGPNAVFGALQASTGSVQTFIDAARPNTYKTHSSQGGAVRGMAATQ